MDMPIPNPAILGRKAAIAAKLRMVLPADAVIDDPAETLAYECDGLTAYRCVPLAVVLPRTTAEVAAVLKLCHGEGVPVVPRGSGTSLAGGALPTADSIVLGVARMNRVLETNYDDRYIRVETGRTNLSVSGAVEADGFFYAPDPSSQLACAIAGNIAMNSGGAHCLKYGVTTNNLLGVTLVLMDGTVVEIGVLPVAIEFMDRPCIRACEDFAHAGYPDCEALLIVEVEGSPAEIDEQLALIKEIALRHDPVEFRESQSEDEAKKIWLGRKSAFGAMGQINDYMCLDGTIPVSALPLVLRRIGEMSREFGLDVANVFHAGDGNMHPLILFDANKPGDLEICEALGAEILKLCVEVGGCLTGEHGVGIEKRDLMNVQYGDADMEAQMRVKDVFDPAWLLNPAKVFPLGLSAARRAD